MSRSRHARPRGRRWRGPGPTVIAPWRGPAEQRRAKPTPGTSADRRFWREAQRTCRAFSRSRAAAMRLRAGRLDLAEAAEEAAYARWVWPE